MLFSSRSIVLILASSVSISPHSVNNKLIFLWEFTFLPLDAVFCQQRPVATGSEVDILPDLDQ